MKGTWELDICGENMYRTDKLLQITVVYGFMPQKF